MILTGCGGDLFKKPAHKVAPQEEQTVATNFLTHLRSRDILQARTMLDPTVTHATDENLANYGAQLRPGAKATIKLVSYQTEEGPERNQSELIYEIDFGDASCFATVVLNRSTTPLTVLALQVSEQGKELHAFTLKNLKPRQIIFLSAWILILLTVLYALVRCLQTKMKDKWMWLLFIFFGLCSVTINWTTLALGFEPLRMLPLGVGIGRMDITQPWVLGVAVPLGAIVFLAKRTHLQLEPDPNGDSDE
jgi:hypothetical protein